MNPKYKQEVVLPFMAYVPLGKFLKTSKPKAMQF